MAFAAQKTKPAATATAGQQPGGRPSLFDRLDTNKDGVITRDEVKADAEKRFAEIDVDGNGFFDQADRDALHVRRVDAHFDKLDSNKDGQISRAEFHAAMDVRHGPDGAPPRDEAGPRGPDGGPDGHRGGPGGPGEGWGGRGGGHFGGDHGPIGMGDISKADFVARALSMFDRFDVNHDGKITAEERAAARGGPHGGRHGDRDGPDGPPPPPRP